jgi:hypothetical protein
MIAKHHKTEWARAFLTAGIGVMLVSGCQRDVRLADKKLRNPTVRAISAYEMTLDEQAIPEQVAYAALRAIADDFRATDDKAREEALDVQFDLCAANEIQRQNRTSLRREEWLYEVVSHWTPTVSHYVEDFPRDWTEAQERFVLRGPTESAEGIEECDVLIEVDDVKAGRDPNARVVIVVWLAKDNGFWRVVHLGFDAQRQDRGADPSRRKIAPNP